MRYTVNLRVEVGMEIPTEYVTIRNNGENDPITTNRRKPKPKNANNKISPIGVIRRGGIQRYPIIDTTTPIHPEKV